LSGALVSKWECLWHSGRPLKPKPGLNGPPFNGVWIVGVKGAYFYKDDAGEKRVGPGDFLRVPGGHKHWSGGDKKEGAVFYEESSGKFDFVPAK